MRFKVLYHVSPKRNLKSIDKYGLEIGRRSPVIELQLWGSKTTTKRNVIYFTDRAGISAVITGWVQCPVVVFKVKVPVNWLEKLESEVRGYFGGEANEWVSLKSIPRKYITHAFDVPGC